MTNTALFTDFTFYDMTVPDKNRITREDIINGNISGLNTITRNIRVYHESLHVLLDILNVKEKTNKIVKSRLQRFTDVSYTLGDYEFCMDDEYLWVIEKNGKSIARYSKKIK